MIDADLYSSSKQALNFCAPLITREALLLMDDWYADDGRLLDRNLGQPRALREFIAEHSEFHKINIGPYSYFDRLAGHVFILRTIDQILLFGFYLRILCSYVWSSTSLLSWHFDL
jgi:hypothetical protein